MPLQNFTFSQASLQTYTDCPRRFQLRYVLNVRWPADHDQPVIERERRAREGQEFHYPCTSIRWASQSRCLPPRLPKRA